MIVNQATLVAIFKNFNTLFQQGLQSAAPLWEKVATRIPSGAKSENYKWLGNLVSLREWIGDRVIQNLAAYGYEIVNKHYEGTMEVDRDDVEDDQLGVYAPVIQMLGFNAALHPDSLVSGLLNNGFTATCFDGQYFFDTDHPRGDGGAVQTNKGTAALSLTEYGNARAAMMKVKNDNGDPLGIIPDTLIVPPALEMTARQILNSETIAIGGVSQTNPYRNTAELVVLPRLTSDTAWSLLQTRGPIKPLIFQDRKKPEFVSLDKPDSPEVFNRNKFRYGVDYRGNAGYGLWQLAYGSTGTV